jgi:hypothetical protein
MKTIFAFLLTLMLGSVPAWAALGEDVSSVNADVQVLGGQHVMKAQAGYNLHQITATDGSVVNEFVTPAGLVFGVSWTGHGVPNLPQLLGNYMTNLQQGKVVQRIPRRAITIQGDNFVFSSMSHFRFFRGRAYVPGLVPPNLTAEVIQ